MDIINALAWVSQFLLAYFFFRSAYRKVTGYERVSAEFLRWGYPFPGQVTFLLIAVWILGGTAILVPAWAGIAAAVLLTFLIVAVATLLFHGEFRRLIEPGRPIVLLLFVIAVRSDEILDVIYQLRG